MRFKELLVLSLVALALAAVSAGCATTERERRGVSHIPFNSPEPRTRTFDGSF